MYYSNSWLAKFVFIHGQVGMLNLSMYPSICGTWLAAAGASWTQCTVWGERILRNKGKRKVGYTDKRKKSEGKHKNNVVFPKYTERPTTKIL